MTSSQGKFHVSFKAISADLLGWYRNSVWTVLLIVRLDYGPTVSLFAGTRYLALLHRLRPPTAGLCAGSSLPLYLFYGVAIHPDNSIRTRCWPRHVSNHNFSVLAPNPLYLKHPSTGHFVVNGSVSIWLGLGRWSARCQIRPFTSLIYLLRIEPVQLGRWCHCNPDRSAYQLNSVSTSWSSKLQCGLYTTSHHIGIGAMAVSARVHKCLY